MKRAKQKKLAIRASMNPFYCLEGMTTILNVLEKRDILKEVPYGPYVPEPRETVFDFLKRVICGGVDSSELWALKQKEDREYAGVIGGFGRLQCPRGQWELALAENKISEMLSLGYYLPHEGDRCIFDPLYPCRPMTNEDGPLLKAAISEAVLELWRIVDQRIVRESAKHFVPSDDKEKAMHEAFMHHAKLYRRLSVGIDALDAVLGAQISEGADYGEPYGELYDEDRGESYDVSLLEALSMSYWHVRRCEHIDEQAPVDPYFEWILSPKNVESLKELGFGWVTQKVVLECNLGRDFDRDPDDIVDIVQYARQLRDLFEAIRTPILRLRRCISPPPAA